MDGFRVSNQFLCKELAWIDLDTMNVRVQYFQVTNDRNFRHLSEKDKKTTYYVTKFVHGMLFRDNLNDSPQFTIDDIFLALAIDSQKRHGCLAYKGGKEEENRCKRLQITNYINLESAPFHCPSFKILVDRLRVCENKSIILKFQKLQCHRHNKVARGVLIHCTKQEVYLFALFVLKHV